MTPTNRPERSSLPNDFLAQLDRVMLVDRPPIKRLFGQIERLAAQGQPTDRDKSRLEQLLNRSLKQAQKRRDSVPKIRFDDELPVSAARDDLAAAIRDNQVVVVAGETGSGKSTQLPKICLELGRGIRGMIGHTQPRRLAARSIGTRIAEELGQNFGEQVGFKIRFADETSQKTLIKLMTDGILLAETQSDRFLDKYDTIILDEAHERSLNIDFLIGYLKQILSKRPDLKLIVTSATIDARRFADHFKTDQIDVPVFEISGRTWPVDIRYRPPVVERRRPLRAGQGEEIELDQLDPVEAVCRSVDELAAEGGGDMLVFLPTERDIHETVKALGGRSIPGDIVGRETEILPLYARLPGTQQQRIFHPGGRRRIVLATNVAESSLTVPRIRYVIDTGTARISRYSARSRTQRLPIESVSRASADQRSGRCGRIGPGVCVRLYAEDDYLARDRYTQPEIQRSNLASVILQSMALNLGDLSRFPFLDPPKPATVRDGFKTLFEIGALDENQKLTDLGRTLSRWPVDPRIGRILVAGAEEHCLREILIIASALEVQDPRMRPLDRQQAADEAHMRFRHESSDFLTYLNIWDFYQTQRKNLSRNQLRKACTQNFLSYPRMREWVDIHRQLKDLIEQAGYRLRGRNDDYAVVHQVILTGLLSGIAMRGNKHEYSAARGVKAYLWPGSSSFSAKPNWLVASELIETDRRYMRTSARIEPEWIEPLAEHLMKRTYETPHWSRRNQSAMTVERVTLFGLPIVARRNRTLGPIDPELARELLIRHGLIEGELRQKPDFLAQNSQVIEELDAWQKKWRARGTLGDRSALYRFYDERIPADCFDMARLLNWWKDQKDKTPDLLKLTRKALTDLADQNFDERAFPDVLEADGGRLPLRYEFAPGTDEDGITVEVPPEGVAQLDIGKLEWLVPGLLESKVTALIKSLPKPLRRRLVPAPDTARQIVGDLDFGQGDFLKVLAQRLSRVAGEPVETGDFDLDRVPRELRISVAVVDGEGETIARGRELPELQNQLGAVIADQLASFDDPRWNRDRLNDWDFDDLPEVVTVRRGELTLRCYPALVDQGNSVSLRLTESPERALTETRRGLVRLFAITNRRDLRKQVAWLPGFDRLHLAAASIGGFKLQDEAVGLLAARAWGEVGSIPRTREQFEAANADAYERIGVATQEVAELLPKLLGAHYEARLAVDKIKTSTWEYARLDMLAQLDRLTEKDFLIKTDWRWLVHFQRFFEAIGMRVERLAAGSVNRDRAATDELAQQWDAYQKAQDELDQAGRSNPELDLLRWMLEEYRVSLFAQRLKTSIPISAKRIHRQWEKC
jgi:ATP-dependent RNA helicase HrpA